MEDELALKGGLVALLGRSWSGRRGVRRGGRSVTIPEVIIEGFWWGRTPVGVRTGRRGASARGRAPWIQVTISV